MSLPFRSLFIQKFTVYSSVLGKTYDVRYVSDWHLAPMPFVVLAVSWADVLLKTKVTAVLFSQSVLCN
jgi:hypothetical protein